MTCERRNWYLLPKLELVICGNEKPKLPLINTVWKIKGNTVLTPNNSITLEWDNNEAHSALYDTQKTSELFCQIFNSHKFELKD